MGGIWDGLGPLLGALGRFFGVRNQPFFKHWSKMGSKRASGAIWGRFWRVLGGFREGFGRILDDFLVDFGSILGRFSYMLGNWF